MPTSNIQYSYTIIYVSDVSKTIDFYKNAFGFEVGFITPEKDYGELKTGTTTLSFANLELGQSNIKTDFIKSDAKDKPFGVELAFVTDDIQQTWAQAINSGATVHAEIETKVWGQEVGYLRDPNGFLIEICTPMHES
jgi:lactoylglutathione lyase